MRIIEEIHHAFYVNFMGSEGGRSGTVLPLAGGAGRILRGTEGLLRSEREQALLSELPPG